MNANEIKELIKTLRECGVTHYKTAEIELDLGPAPVVSDAATNAITPEIEHKIEQMKSIMNTSDAELLDMLYPDTVPAEDAEDSVSPN